MSKIYYKVVQRNLQSCSLSAYFPSSFRVTYKIGQFVRPNVSKTKLFIFENLEDAEKFRNNECCGSIWDIYSCEVKNPSKPKYIAWISNIAEFWKIKFNHKKISDEVGKEPITGTVFCDAVKLLEKVS